MRKEHTRVYSTALHHHGNLPVINIYHPGGIQLCLVSKETLDYRMAIKQCIFIDQYVSDHIKNLNKLTMVEWIVGLS